MTKMIVFAGVGKRDDEIDYALEKFDGVSHHLLGVGRAQASRLALISALSTETETSGLPVSSSPRARLAILSVNNFGMPVLALMDSPALSLRLKCALALG